jgi:CNT family concentrative nucleoside transporter
VSEEIQALQGQGAKGETPASLPQDLAPLPPVPSVDTLGGRTPKSWRWAILCGVVLLGLLAFWLQDLLGARGQAAVGVACLLGLTAALSWNLKAVNWRTLGWGLGLQILLIVLILRFRVYGLEWLGIRDGTRPVYQFFEVIADVVKQFLEFTDRGARFVFGPLAHREHLGRAFGKDNAFVFAFSALPPIIFVSSFFTVLYYFGVLQFIVRVMARVMMYLMRTSGAETLSASANVFMGQTEAPLIIKPYLNGMTQSELLAVMVGGMATIAGGIMAVYIGMGADAVALLATSVMAAPCSLYLSKLVLPETGTPQTSGTADIVVEEQHANAIDAAAAGASDGLKLALNVAAMLIAFLAFLALFDYLLGQVASGQSLHTTFTEASGPVVLRSLFALGITFLAVAWLTHVVLKAVSGFALFQRFRTGGHRAWLINLAVLAGLFPIFLGLLELLLVNLPERLSLSVLFARIFAPVAFLIGVQGPDIGPVADVLGIKLAANEFVAFDQLTTQYRSTISARAFTLATFALTGFANFASVGIQLGGIGAMAPSRRGDLARLGPWALYIGFTATLINAAIAGILL